MWEAILQGIFWIINLFHELFGDWGLSIIIITIIFRIIVSPLMHKQAQSTYKQQKIQPLMAEIDKKYGNDKVRANEEKQKLLSEVGFNPLTGCLPMLLQMPIFIAMFQVLREIQNYTDVPVETMSFYNIVPSLITTPSGALEQGILTFIPYLILVIIFAGATFLPMALQQMKNKDNPQNKQTLIMAVVMSIMMIWIAWGSPAGVLLFWGVSSLIGIAQNQISTSICKKKDEELEEKKAYEAQAYDVNVERKQKKARPKKKK